MSGLEIIGVAASIIQVADLGTSLSVKLFSFYRRVKNANETIQLLSNEVALVSAILRELGDSLKVEESSKLCSEEAFQTLEHVLEQCRGVLRQIEKVVDVNDQSSRSRLQQVTGKFKLVLLEPSLEPLKADLDRLKSTMLLLLNVIMFAGKVRNHNIPNDREERALIEALLQEKHLERNSENYSPPNYQQSQHHILDSKIPGDAPKSNLFQRSEFAEVNEYNELIQKMLHKIDSCKSKLENSRYSRIRKGVLNIHDTEIIRFQLTHGHSVLHHFDKSLLIDEKDSSEIPRVHTSDNIHEVMSKEFSPQTTKKRRSQHLMSTSIEALAVKLRKWVLVTTDGLNFRLVDISDIPTVATLRAVICQNLGISDCGSAEISLAEPGQLKHGEPMSDINLAYCCRIKSDPGAPLKLFVRGVISSLPLFDSPELPVAEMPCISPTEAPKSSWLSGNEPEILQIKRKQKAQYLSKKENHVVSGYKCTEVIENKTGPLKESPTFAEATSPGQSPVHSDYSRVQITVQTSGLGTELASREQVNTNIGTPSPDPVTSSTGGEDAPLELDQPTALCSPTSPAYSPVSPSFSPTSPAYSPTSPSYSPASLSNREAGGSLLHYSPQSPVFYSPVQSRGKPDEEFDDEAKGNTHSDSPSATNTVITLPARFEDLLLRWTKLGLNEVEAL